MLLSCIKWISISLFPSNFIEQNMKIKFIRHGNVQAYQFMNVHMHDKIQFVWARPTNIPGVKLSNNWLSASTFMEHPASWEALHPCVASKPCISCN